MLPHEFALHLHHDNSLSLLKTQITKHHEANFYNLSAVLACVFNANAQFVVDSLGKVSVGEETDPQSQVYVLDKANENGLTVHNMARIRSGSVTEMETTGQVAFTRNVTVQKGAQLVIKKSSIRK